RRRHTRSKRDWSSDVCSSDLAIKVLHPELATSLGVERFLREIGIAAGLTHPHILALYDSGRAADLLYYVMPYIEGETLRGRLEQIGRASCRERVEGAGGVGWG